MSDFDEQFKKQFGGQDKEPQPQKEEEVDSHKRTKDLVEGIAIATTTPEKEEEEIHEGKRKRIRSKFFTGLFHGKKEEKHHEKGHGFFHNLFVGLANVLIIIGVVVLIRTFLVSPFSVVGSSMSSNLINGDLILVDKLSYRISEPSRGDIIVFHPPINEMNEQKGILCRAKKIGYVILGKDSENACISRDFFVKRIIGIPGDTVEIRNRKVFVTPKDGKRVEIEEGFLDTKNQNNTCFSPNCNSSRDTNGVFVEVPEGALYVLGDNRTGSSDSRKWQVDGKDTPFVQFDDIAGRVRMIFFPFSHISILPTIDLMKEEEEENAY